jgi:two-component system chemotaxis sensor kinase CheA
MNALHEQFIAESRELIHQATGDLIAAEKDGFSPDRIDRVFRAFHTLKGSAGVVDLPLMGLIMHAAEDLLAAMSAGRVGPSKAVIDQILACLDQTSKWVDAFESDQALPSRAGEDARAIADRLRGLASGVATVGREAEVADKPRELPDWVNRVIASRSRDLYAGAGDQKGPLLALAYEPAPGCFFDGDDPFALMQRVPKLLAFRAEAREAWPPLQEFDPYSCNLRLLGLSAATHAELAAIFRLVPDQVRFFEIPPGAIELAADTKAIADQPSVFVRAVIEEQRLLIRATKGERGDAGRFLAAARAGANALRHAGQNPLAERLQAAGAAAVATGDPAPLLSAIDEALAVLAAKADGGSGASAVEQSDGSHSRSLRVDEAKIDALVDLAGEFLVAKNGLAHLAKRVEDELAGQDLARAVRRQHDVIDRLSSELHAAVLQLRLVPVAQVFRPFPRLVRDMSQQLKKNVTLVTEGETTESDKTIVDSLFEPLMHLVRNALDHGIETSQQRREAGKPPGATLTLRAARTGDRFAIDVIDDGRGIDPVVVRRKAEEKGLLTAAELEALSDEDAVDLVFSAGFSTADEISNISGRGVGMDVVRTTIERIGGRVSLKSRVGVGTTVSLDLPMNMALLQIMVVEAGGQVFGIPMDAVTETVRLTPDRISRIKNNDGFVLRDRVVPICSLAELMNLPAKKKSEADVRLVVAAESGGRTAAIEVDAIRDRLEIVLKPMHGLLSGARGYAGTTLLGDGTVLLVLDLKEILP